MIILLLTTIYIIEFITILLVALYCTELNIPLLLIPIIIIPFMLVNWLTLKFIKSYRLNEINKLYGKPTNTFFVSSALHTVMLQHGRAIIALYPKVLLIKYIVSGKEYIILKDKLCIHLKEGFNGTVLEFEIETDYAYKVIQFLPSTLFGYSERIQDIAYKINKFYELNNL